MGSCSEHALGTPQTPRVPHATGKEIHHEDGPNLPQGKPPMTWSPKIGKQIKQQGYNKKPPRFPLWHTCAPCRALQPTSLCRCGTALCPKSWGSLALQQQAPSEARSIADIARWTFGKGIRQPSATKLLSRLAPRRAASRTSIFEVLKVSRGVETHRSSGCYHISNFEFRHQKPHNLSSRIGQKSFPDCCLQQDIQHVLRREYIHILPKLIVMCYDMLWSNRLTGNTKSAFLVTSHVVHWG